MSRQRTGSLDFDAKVGYVARLTIDLPDEKTERRRFVLGTRDKARAERLKAKLVADINAGRYVTEAKATLGIADTVVALAWPWNEQRKAAGVAMWMDEKIHLRDHILPELGKLFVTEIETSHCQRVIDAAALRDAKLPKTNTPRSADAPTRKLGAEYLRKIRGTMARLFKEARRQGLITHNPTELVTIPKRKKGSALSATILADEEIAQFMAHPAVSLELKMLSIVSRTEGGMRTGELNAWDWAHIAKPDFDSCEVYRSKTDEWQTLPVPDMLRPFLAAWWAKAGRPEQGPVFPSRRGPSKGCFKAKRGNSYAARLRRDLLRAGVTRFDVHNRTARTRPADFHSFRRAFCTALGASGVNIQTAMHLANHSDPKTAARYVIARDSMGVVPLAALPQFNAEIAESFGLALAESKQGRHETAQNKHAPVAQLDRASAFEAVSECALKPNQSSTRVTATLGAPRCFAAIRCDSASLANCPEARSSSFEYDEPLIEYPGSEGRSSAFLQ